MALPARNSNPPSQTTDSRRKLSRTTSQASAASSFFSSKKVKKDGDVAGKSDHNACVHAVYGIQTHEIGEQSDADACAQVLT